MPERSSTLWFGGRVFTGSRYVEAILAESGRIRAAGTDREVRQRTPAGAERRDLRGRLVVPGLIDSHLHWADSVLAADAADLRRASSLEEIRQRLHQAAERWPNGPLIGTGWDQERLEERRYPTRDDLDSAFPDRPVVLLRVCQHVALLNTAALDSLCLDSRTPDPFGGRFERGKDGTLTGVLVDRALEVIRPILEAAFRARPEGAQQFLKDAAARGLTTLGLMRVHTAELERADGMQPAGGFPVTLLSYVAPDLLRSVIAGRPRARSDGHSVIGVKLVLDGSLGARTAWLESPYTDALSSHGLSLVGPEEADSVLASAVESGIGVAVHAIGDRALRQAIELGERWPGGLRIEHASLVPPGLEDRLVRLGAPVVVQPGFVVSDTWIPERLGHERSAWAYPIRRLLDRGVNVAASSDAPVESLDPWVGIRTLVDRIGLPHETALGLYTVGAARALSDPTRGHLEEGAQADLVIVGATDLASAIAGGGPVEAVVHGGRPVFGEGAI